MRVVSTPTDLTTLPGCPNHAPQVLEIVPGNYMGGTLDCVDYQGQTHSMPVRSGDRIRIPVSTLLAGVPAIGVVALWWPAPGWELNP